MPLIARGSLKGALNIYRLGEDASFDEDEFELAQAGSATPPRSRSTTRRSARGSSTWRTTDSLTGLYNHRYFHERLALGAPASAAARTTRSRC